MDISSQRPLLHTLDEWSIPQKTEALFHAIRDSGPALAFGPVGREYVDLATALVLTTSGTTGIAKEVALSTKALVASAKAAHKYLGAKSGQRWSLLLPTTHIAGINVLIRSIELGTTPIDNRNRDEYINADFVAIVPTQLHRALRGDEKLLKHLQSAQGVLVGGAAASDELVSEAKAQGIPVVTTYGMTETSGGCIYDGQPLPGVEVRINDSGAIEISGPMLASDYLNQHGLWSQVTSDGWFTTSDLGVIENGKVRVLGRNDDQIISGGIKISLSTIETELLKSFPLQKFMAFSLEDLEWGEILCLASDEAINKKEIGDHLASVFGNFAIPKEFHHMAELPVKGIGKPDRIRLVELVLSKKDAERN
jgi:O-succinylbenzoic acid--CoA ligase